MVWGMRLVDGDADCVVDVYMAGDFLIALNTADYTLDHVTGLLAYDIDEDAYVDTFNGGVYKNSGFLNILQDTPL